MAELVASPGLEGRRFGVVVGGGIAAYKACELVRALRRDGASVRVAMTAAATRFVTPLTLEGLSGAPVLVDFLDVRGDGAFGHLELARWAHVLVVAPATADLLARIRMGLADSVAAAAVLAFRGPLILAPAMNTAMWENAATRENVEHLRTRSGVELVGPASGLLADGDVGQGRLAEVQQIAAHAIRAATPATLAGRSVLVTAGPTREPLDPVRFLSNPSTGRMGIALAAEAWLRGAAATLILGPSECPDPPGVDVIRVQTAAQMRDEVLARLSGTDVLIAAAAVSDFRPARPAEAKVKKSDAATDVALAPTADILAEAAATLRGRSKPSTIVGFAAETEDLAANAREKLARKRLDWIVGNLVGRSGQGFASDANEVLVLGPGGFTAEKAGSKVALARWLWDLWS
jgi:phosphopantothenoylcysteine decarboxylase/phosphopantothenate--cysteine ligase